MPTPLIMPKFEMSQEKGTIVNWLHQEGDWVEKGEPILEVETDKVVMEVEAPVTGYLRDIKAQVGDRVPVTSVIAIIIQPDEVNPREVFNHHLENEEDTAHRRESPLAQRMARSAGIDIRQVPPSHPGGRVTRLDVERFLKENKTTPADNRQGAMESVTGLLRATPAARRAAREAKIDLTTVTGSGPHHRIQEVDVRTYSQARSGKSLPKFALSGQPFSSSPSQLESDGIPPGEEIIPLEGMRRTIADRMQYSYQTAPHVTFSVEVDMNEASALLKKLNAQHEALNIPHISVTAFLVKVCAWTLPRHPWLNASLIGENIHRHISPNIGVAVTLKDGVIVPVIHQADQLSLSEISRRIKDYTERATLGRLTLQDVANGTFTISNLGMYGIDQFTAILNPPQCAILAVGRIVKKAVVIETPDGDQIAIRPMMKMTLSADHRILDGVLAARFLQDVVAVLEEPDFLLV